MQEIAGGVVPAATIIIAASMTAVNLGSRVLWQR
jgi:hypothetical protein